MVDRTLDNLIAALPLKEMDGTLLQRAIGLEEIRINKADPKLKHQFNYVMMSKAMDTASFLHRSQTRANRANLPRTHYIEHPLRNALRLMRYGCTDQNIVIAALLHDTVEDCILEYLQLDGSHESPVEWTGAQVAFDYINRHFNWDVMNLVRAVTNPEPPEMDYRTRAQKRADYVTHVTKAIENPRVALLKLSDFIDNAAGLYHNDVTATHGMVSHLAQKYLPLVDVFFMRSTGLDFAALVSFEGLAKIQQQLIDAKKTLSELAILR